MPLQRPAAPILALIGWILYFCASVSQAQLSYLDDIKPAWDAIAKQTRNLEATYDIEGQQIRYYMKDGKRLGTFMFPGNKKFVAGQNDRFQFSGIGGVLNAIDSDQKQVQMDLDRMCYLNAAFLIPSPDPILPALPTILKRCPPTIEGRTLTTTFAEVVKIRAELDSKLRISKWWVFVNGEERSSGWNGYPPAKSVNYPYTMWITKGDKTKVVNLVKSEKCTKPDSFFTPSGHGMITPAEYRRSFPTWSLVLLAALLLLALSLFLRRYYFIRFRSSSPAA